MRVKENTVGRDRRVGDYRHSGIYLPMHFRSCAEKPLFLIENSLSHNYKFVFPLSINCMREGTMSVLLLYPHGIEDGDTQENRRVSLLSKC